MTLCRLWSMVSQTLGKHSSHLPVDVRIIQTLKNFGVIAWKKREGLQATQRRKKTLHLQQRQRSSRSPPLNKRRERNLKVSSLMFQKWNAIIATSLDTFPGIASKPRRNLKEDFKTLLQKQKKKKKTKANKEEEPRREYYLISSLSGSIKESTTSWLVDRGVSRNMIGNRGALTRYRKKKFTTQMELVDDSTYKIEGVGSTSLQLDSGTVLRVDDILIRGNFNSKWAS